MRAAIVLVLCATSAHAERDIKFSALGIIPYDVASYFGGHWKSDNQSGRKIEVNPTRGLGVRGEVGRYFPDGIIVSLRLDVMHRFDLDTNDSYVPDSIRELRVAGTAGIRLVRFHRGAVHLGIDLGLQATRITKPAAYGFGATASVFLGVRHWIAAPWGWFVDVAPIGYASVGGSSFSTESAWLARGAAGAIYVWR